MSRQLVPKKSVMVPSSATQVRKVYYNDIPDYATADPAKLELGEFKVMKGTAPWGQIDDLKYTYTKSDKTTVKAVFRTLYPPMWAEYGLSKGMDDEEKKKREQAKNGIKVVEPPKEELKEDDGNKKAKPIKYYAKLTVDMTNPDHVALTEYYSKFHETVYPHLFGIRGKFQPMNVSLSNPKGSDLFVMPFAQSIDDPNLVTITIKDEPWGPFKSKYLMPDGKTLIEKEEFMGRRIFVQARVSDIITVAAGKIYWKHRIDEIMLLDFTEIQSEPTSEEIADRYGLKDKHFDALMQKIAEEKKKKEQERNSAPEENKPLNPNEIQVTTTSGTGSQDTELPLQKTGRRSRSELYSQAAPVLN